MTDPAAAPVVSLPPVRRVQAILTPAADTPIGAVVAKKSPSRLPNLTDLWLALADRETAWVTVQVSPGGDRSRLEVPRTEPDNMVELLETLYLLGGWTAVDEAVHSASISLVGAVSAILGIPRGEQFAISALLHERAPLLIPPDHVALAADALAVLRQRANGRQWPAVIAGLDAIVPFNGMFARGPTEPDMRALALVPANNELDARLYADALIALERARDVLAGRVVDILRQAEVEAVRQLDAALTDARAVIVRETLRYFDLKKDSIHAALTQLIRLHAATDEKSASGEKYPIAKDPKALQKALETLIPFSDALLFHSKKSPGITPSVAKMVDEKMQQARDRFALEVARHGQGFSVLYQINAAQVRPASTAKSERLGAIVFPILSRAYQANRATHSLVNRFVSIIDAVADDRHPDRALVELGKRKGRSGSIWVHAKYVERAAARVTANSDDLARKVLEGAMAALGGAAGIDAASLAESGAEMLLMGTTSHFLPKLLPVVNVAAAAWHITKAVKEFKDNHDDFYCTLDPRDALVPAPPSAGSLALDIASEAAFVFI